MTAKVFWILYIMNSANSAGFSVDHYNTQIECEAARKTVIEVTSPWWKGRIKDDEAFCWRVEVPTN